jgi:hypothetical protein
MLRRLLGKPGPNLVPTALRPAVEDRFRAFGHAYMDANAGITEAMGAGFFAVSSTAVVRGENELKRVEALRKEAMLSIDEIERLWPESTLALSELRGAASLVADLCQYTRAALASVETLTSQPEAYMEYDPNNILLNRILTQQKQRMLNAQHSLLRSGIDLATVLGQDIAGECGLRL